MKKSVTQIWQYQRFTLDCSQDGKFTTVKKTPFGEVKEVEVDGFFDLSIKQAQDYMDNRYPGHLIINVKEK